jgi:hypothetical protein
VECAGGLKLSLRIASGRDHPAALELQFSPADAVQVTDSRAGEENQKN